tara:strand:+ start:247 stop:495 length:249 start_codon:yes stop_codon:yes gene_type:complete
MEAIRIFVNGKKEGIMAITDPKEVLDQMLDGLNDAKTDHSREYILKCIDSHQETPLTIIPTSSEPFDWDENIHGKWIINKSN